MLLNLPDGIASQKEEWQTRSDQLENHASVYWFCLKPTSVCWEDHLRHETQPLSSSLDQNLFSAPQSPSPHG